MVAEDGQSVDCEGGGKEADNSGIKVRKAIFKSLARSLKSPKGGEDREDRRSKKRVASAGGVNMEWDRTIFEGKRVQIPTKGTLY